MKSTRFVLSMSIVLNCCRLSMKISPVKRDGAGFSFRARHWYDKVSNPETLVRHPQRYRERFSSVNDVR